MSGKWTNYTKNILLITFAKSHGFFFCDRQKLSHCKKPQPNFVSVIFNSILELFCTQLSKLSTSSTFSRICLHSRSLSTFFLHFSSLFLTYNLLLCFSRTISPFLIVSLFQFQLNSSATGYRQHFLAQIHSSSSLTKFLSLQNLRLFTLYFILL